MAALSADYVPAGWKMDWTMANPLVISAVADDEVFKFSLLEVDADGDIGPFSAADSSFAGVAILPIDNTGGSAGDVSVTFAPEIILKGIDLAGTTPDVGDSVYCDGTDNPADLTTTDPGSGTVLGKVVGRYAEGTDADYDVLLISNIFSARI